MALSDFIDKFGGWTEGYYFYNGEIELRYDPKEHVYLLLTEDGELEKQDGVTNVCHIIDKSNALVPWGCKMMANKLFATIPKETMELDDQGGTEGYFFKPLELEKWVLDAKTAHKEKLEEAGMVGHMAHNWIEQYIKLAILVTPLNTMAQLELEKHLSTFPTEERSKNACIAALDWMSRHNVRWLAAERKIYSRKYKYAGTMDGLCICDSCDDHDCCPMPFKARLSVADWKTSNYLYLEYLFQTAAYEAAYEEEFGVDIQDRWVIRLGKDDGEFESWHLEEHNFADDFGGFLDALDLTRRVRIISSRIAERKAGIAAALKTERAEARRLKDEQEALDRAESKAEKQKARIEALALKCTKAEKYKAKKKPSCVAGKDGEPCVSCSFKWAKTLENREAESAKRPAKKLEAADLKALSLVIKPKVVLPYENLRQAYEIGELEKTMLPV